MEQTLAPQHGKGPDHLDQPDLCLLSLDGGGVRGLSTLQILKGLMTRLNNERKADNLLPVKPCEVFDIIGGTSTGGLIAIMLGRLEMDVDECISAYVELMKAVFESKSRSLPFNIRGRTKPRFDSTKLEIAIKQVITSRGVSENALFNDGTDRNCNVFVCTIAKETTDITRLRSYSLLSELDIPATICEAALATSAATGFFDPVCIGERKFVDGALGANNPVCEVEGEASDIWCPETADLKPRVKCFISIGTGDPGKKAIEDNIIKFLSRTLVAITTETGKTAEQFVARWRQHYDESRYFRFNVQQGLQTVRLAEYREQGTIEAATAAYLRHQEQKFRVRDCVANLRQKQKPMADADFNSQISEYKSRGHLQLQTPSHVACWFVPFARNTRFAGRHLELSKLENALFAEGQSRKVAVIGLGGVGKTQIAIEFAYRTQEKHPECAVFWVPAIDLETFQQAYREIGRQLQIPGIDDKQANIKELLKRHLSQESVGEWLLIFDNADDIEMWISSADNPDDSRCLINYLPTSNKGSVLFTTRNRKAAIKLARQSVVEVAEMDEDTGIEVLSNSLIDQEILNDRQAMLELLNQLTFLPLAIVQASAYINENCIALSEYLSFLNDTEENVIELLSEDFEEEWRYRDSKNPVAATWLVSFDQIRHRDPLAIEYLSFMSCLEPKNIPPFLLPPAQSKKKGIDAIGTLSAYSFITKRPGNQSLDLHRLVHLATRNWLQQKQLLLEWTGRAIARMAEVFPNSNHKNRTLWRTLLPHAHCILESNVLSESVEWRLPLLEKFSGCLYSDGRHDEAERTVSQVLEIREKVLGQEHPDTLASMNNLALMFSNQGRWKEAEELGIQVLEMTKRVLGREHPDTLMSMNNLALTFWKQGRWKEAEELGIQVLEIRKRVLGQEHPDTLISMNNLAITFSKQGRWKEAEELQVQVLEISKRVSGQEHLDTLRSMNNLASTFWKQGRWEEAEELQVQVLEIRKRVLGQEHPDTLTSMNNLAYTLNSQGHSNKAIDLMAECARLREKKLRTKSSRYEGFV
ncbi:hypothetical protein G7Y89_g4890 [Cudoniella acicularis]|uniref:PNPLA domain-containing protein n=1 Tax=Cudoniella acicularis TaxID=354080 RepID=A0A8H4RQ06_9HELO|nr:hypothetical protein G7Y89_g4890 [Cudoniella acicularis]